MMRSDRPYRHHHGYSHGVITPLSWNLTPIETMTQPLDIAIPFQGETPEHVTGLDNHEINSQT